MNFTIHHGDNRDILKTFPHNHFDAIVTDPPYGIDFLGKDWDANTGALETYTECLRVLKPGGYLLAFSAARTYHHLAVTLEQAGFEIRDQLMWLYASGFPKAQDIGKAIQRRQGVEKTKPSKGMNGYAEVKDKKGKEKWMNPGNISAEDYPEKKDEVVCTSPEAQQWAGWKTALKPAHEPICMARKPFKGSTIDNVLTHGVGALNIDATRIDTVTDREKNWTPQRQTAQSEIYLGGAKPGDTQAMYDEAGRFPSNVIGAVEGYQKFFYCPKVSRKERHWGFETPPDPLANYSQGDVKNHPLWDPSIGTNVQRLKHKIMEHNKDLGKEHQVEGNVGNNHPTVKPVELMKYLIKLVTPPNSIVLDPFSGSGSTGMAATELGHTFHGCELDENYVQISETRIRAWNTHSTPNNFKDLFDE